jgi:glycopeptide antibiotics resistance protein
MLQIVKLKYIFALYLIFLFNFVVLKFFGDFGRVIDRVEGIQEQRMYGYWNISLIPFKTINSSIETFLRVGLTPSTINFIANIFVFIPLGFMIPLLLRRSSFVRTITICFLVIIGIEIFQFIICLGSADIDDVILNMTGCFVGYIICMFARKLLGLNQPKV